MTDLHTNFYTYALQYLAQRISQCQDELIQLRESKSVDTKSSMGDKYETSGEMIQQEIERWLDILTQVKDQKMQLEKIQSTFSPSEHITLGSIFQTEKGLFFLGLPLGKINLTSKSIFALSAQSPLGKLFMGKKAGDTIAFQQQKYHIQALIY